MMYEKVSAAAIARSLEMPGRSFFLFGPRGVGKSTWLTQNLPPDCPRIDLLETGTCLQLGRDPGLLEAKLGPMRAGSWVAIDEVQKVPMLLGEVHRLMETRRWRFALSGSSARKLRRGGADLLAGRAVTRSMEQFTSAELGARFDLARALAWGVLPQVALEPESARDILRAYVHTYIREEIKEEGLVRKVEPFLRFLEVAGIMNGQQVNAGAIARDAAVPRSSVDVYFSILEDTLLGHWLPAYRPQAKVRERAHPKFYWFDPGVARGAAGLLDDPVDSLWLGRALETLVFHELRVYNEVSGKHRAICFYRTAAGAEIDFVVETRKRTATKGPVFVCVEVKLASRWNRAWESQMRSLAGAGVGTVAGMYGVYTGREPYFFEGVQVLPVTEFLRRLHAGEIF